MDMPREMKNKILRGNENMEKLIGLKERLVAIGEFADESVKIIEELIANNVPVTAPVVKTATAPAKVNKPKLAVALAPAPAKAEVTSEANELADIIAEYELNDKTIPELKEILNDAEVEYNKKAKNQSYFVGVVAQAIADGIIGGDEEVPEPTPAPVVPPKTVGKGKLKPAPVVAPEPEPEPEEDEVDLDAIAETYGLNDMEIPALKEMCDDYELTYLPKAKKPTLIAVIATAIADGTIDTSDDDEDETPADEGETEEEVSAEVLEAEDKIRTDLAKKVKTGKLTIKKIKEFLKQYYEGDADCSDCKKCSDEEIVECYIDIHVALVDDDADIAEFSAPYERRGMSFCCGKELVELENGNLSCTICGEEFQTE